MHLLIEFLMFLVAVPALLLYAIHSMLRAVAAFFGWTLMPGVLGLYLGAVLQVLGRPDPTVEWKSSLQTVAGLTVFGIPLPFVLMIAGGAFLSLGAILRLAKGIR